MEVLEFMLSTWWYSSIAVFIITLFVCKKAEGFVTVKNFLKSLWLGSGGYLSLLTFLLIVIYEFFNDEEIGNKKLF